VEVQQHIRHVGPVEAVTLDNTGERIAVVSGQAEREDSADEPPGAQLHLYGRRGGKLDLCQSLSLLAYGIGRRVSDMGRLRFPATRIAFRDERRLLVLRSIGRFSADRALHGGATELFGIDLETGEEVGHYAVGDYDYYPSLLLLSPKYALLGRAKTALCVDVLGFREVWNAQTVGQRGGELGVDEDPDENVAPNGYVYDDRAGRLWVLSGQFNEAFLQCYQLDGQQATLTRLWRRSILEGHEPAGLCLHPGGGAITASLQIFDDLIDLWGKPVPDWVQAHQEMLRLRLALDAVPPPPQSARLGCLLVVAEEMEKRLDVYSAFDRDFIHGPQTAWDSRSGQSVNVGYRLGAGVTGRGNNFMTQPIYLDARCLVVGTPSGLLLRVDADSGQSEVVHDFQSPICCLQFWPRFRQLLAGCENGTLTVLAE
jgi:hypothetical protein